MRRRAENRTSTYSKAFNMKINMQTIQMNFMAESWWNCATDGEIEDVEKEGGKEAESEATAEEEEDIGEGWLWRTVMLSFARNLSKSALNA